MYESSSSIFSFLFSSLRAEIWWQMVVVIAGVDRISLSTGMKLMAREWYGHARHPAKFHDSVMRREPFGARPPRFRYIPGITYRPFRRTSMSATQLRIPCIWLRCIACMYTLRRGELFERYREGGEDTMVNARFPAQLCSPIFLLCLWAVEDSFWWNCLVNCIGFRWNNYIAWLGSKL